MFLNHLMIIFKTVQDITNYVDNQLVMGKKLGFVPTMGALHSGHISLVKNAQTEMDITISSIFVNPTQFNNATDLAKYPITLEADIALLENNHCDVLYLPSVAEVYPNGIHHLRHYELGNLEKLLDGAFRPGHFQGVCNVLNILFDTIKPTAVYMGLKDFQQCAVVDKLLEIMKSSIELKPCETLREPSGLAMSSRNARLGAEAKIKASKIFKALTFIKINISTATFKQNKATCLEILGPDFETEYISLLDTNTWQLLEDYNTNTTMCVLIATWLDGIRLIDNIKLN
jgi:pantoate--beta-alanine ligase